MRSVLECHALVVGINDYHGGITPLQSAARDAEAISRLLATEHGYQVRCLINAEATASAILDGFEQATRSLSEESGFVFYFAGHGIALGDGSDGPQGFLLAQDALPTDDTTWLSMDAVRQALERLPCRHLLVVLDCCFAGSFRWSSSRDAMLVSQPLYDSQFARYLDGQAWQALTSASHDQRAADTLPGRRNTRDKSEGEGHSPFASALLRGLSGSADSARAQHPPDGVITATELYQYLFDELAPANAPSRQTPGLWPLRPSNVGEFVFLNPKVALNTQPDPPLDDENNPWLGLRAYGAADSGLFFGRQRVVDALVERANEPGISLLVVVGASGTGKSSVVMAGLLPALNNPALQLDADNRLVESAPCWQVSQAPRLRADPSVQLGEALASLPIAKEGCRQLLLIDQFEELYTQCRDPELRQHFLQKLRALVDQPDGPLLVLTLRSDFEPRLAGSEQFSELLPAARFLVPTFNTEEMRQVIDAPLNAKALYFDPPELVDKLLDEVAAMPGALPLLSFALAEMYRQAQRRRRQTGSADRALSEDDYHVTGGVVGALHRRATALYDDADTDLKITIKRAFLRMVLQEGPRITRRRVSLVELKYRDPEEQARVDKVLADYVGARLLIVDQQYIEPAHDTLVVAWDLLQEWLAEGNGQTVMRALWRAARDWDAASRPSGLLWNDDPRLPQAKELSAEFNSLEEKFVRASARRKTNRRRVLEVIVLAIIGILAYAAIYSMERADEAIRQTEIAEERLARWERSEGSANLATATTDLAKKQPFKAAMSAAEAVGYRHFGLTAVSTNPEIEASLPPRLLKPSDELYIHTIMTLTEANLATLRPVAWRELHRATVAANANILAGGNGVDGIEVRDLDADRLVVLPAPADELQRLVLSPDGRQLAALIGSQDQAQRVILWRSDDEWQQVNPEALDFPLDSEVIAMTFSPDGQQFAIGMTSEIVVWDVSRKPAAQSHWLDLRMSNGPNLRSSLAFSTDGMAVLSGGWHNRITRYDLPPAVQNMRRAESVRPQGIALGPEWTLWPEHTQKGDYVNAIELSADGEFAVIASANQILLAKIEGNRFSFEDQPVYQGGLEITSIALSADGQLLAVNDGDVVRLLNVPSLQLAGSLIPQTFRPSQTASLDFFDNGQLLMLGGPGQIELVDVSGANNNYFALESEIDLPVIGGGDRIRKMIDTGRLDPVVLAFPDPTSRPENLDWQLDDTDDGLVVDFTQPQPDDEPRDYGFIQLALPPGSEQRVAVGVDKFAVRELRGSDRAFIEIFNVADQALEFRYLFDSEKWGIYRLRFSDDGERLIVVASNFDGGNEYLYSFPGTQPDLTVYVKESMCQAPVNVAAIPLLAETTLLDCEPVAD